MRANVCYNRFEMYWESVPQMTCMSDLRFSCFFGRMICTECESLVSGIGCFIMQIARATFPTFFTCKKFWCILRIWNMNTKYCKWLKVCTPFLASMKDHKQSSCILQSLLQKSHRILYHSHQTQPENKWKIGHNQDTFEIVTWFGILKFWAD
jgi:hypothetical protein